MKEKKGWDWFYFLLLVLLAAGIRVIPEIKGGYWAIGYDTFNTYIPDLIKFDGNFNRWFLTANFLYFLIWPFYKFFSIDPQLLIKITGSVLYGGLAGSFYWFCRKFLGWKSLASFLAGLLLIFQLPALRLSWDLFRNTLALIFLFGAFYFLDTSNLLSVNKLKNLIFLGLFSILIVLSNQLVTSVYLVVLLVFLWSKISDKEFLPALKILLFSAPAIIFFIFILRTPGANTFAGHVIYEGDANRVFNYFDVYRNEIQYRDLASIILNLFWLCYALLLPLAIYGFWLQRKNLILTTMTSWLLVGVFSSLIFGGFGLFVWDRWLLMLVFPLTIYAISALLLFNQKIRLSRLFKNKISIKVYPVLSILLVVAYLGIFIARSWPFITAEYDDSRPPFLNKKLNSYFPPTMVHNAVGFENIRHLLAALDYLNRKAPPTSIILVDNRYRGLLLTNFDYSKRFIYSYPWQQDINKKAIDSLRKKDRGPIYTIWSSQEDIPGFQRVFYSSLIAIYRDKQTYRSYLKGVGEE